VAESLGQSPNAQPRGQVAEGGTAFKMAESFERSSNSKPAASSSEAVGQLKVAEEAGDILNSYQSRDCGSAGQTARAVK